jgi:hypothetical protein
MNGNHGKGVFFIVLSLTLVVGVFLTSFAGSVQAAAGSLGRSKFAAFPEHQKIEGVALYAILVDDAVRLDQAQAGSRVLYSHVLSAHGDYLLVGADPEEGRQVDFPKFAGTIE